MVKFAYLFPGQGAQYVGMGSSIYENFYEAKKVFDEANAVLDFDLAGLCFKGPLEELSRTENCQIAVLTVSIAALRVFESLYGNVIGIPAFTAGLSLGEYSALVASGVIDFGLAAALVRKRGIFMADESKKNPGKMLMIIGLSAQAVKEVCNKTGTEIANFNSPAQIVISGKVGGIEDASSLAKQYGAKKTLVLDVSGPFHSSLMDEAGTLLRAYIEKVPLSSARIPVISNFSAEPMVESEVIKDNLINQVNHTTRWEESVRYMVEHGVSRFIEIGPGNVLKGLIRKISPQVVVHNIEDITSIEDFKNNVKDICPD
jgi:[acyl-carrier-protein] S-malonyltransferase